MNDQYLTPETMSNEEATYDKIKDQTIAACELRTNMVGGTNTPCWSANPVLSAFPKEVRREGRYYDTTAEEVSR